MGRRENIWRGVTTNSMWGRGEETLLPWLEFQLSFLHLEASMCRLLLMNVALWEPLETWTLLWEIPFAVCSTYTKNNMVLLNLIMMVIIIIGSTLNKQKENVEGFSSFIRGHIILRAVRLTNRCLFKLEKWLKALSLSSKVKVSFFNSCNLKSLNKPCKIYSKFFLSPKKNKKRVKHSFVINMSHYVSRTWEIENINTFVFNQAIVFSLSSLNTCRLSSPLTSHILSISSDLRQPVSLQIDGCSSSKSSWSRVLN